MEIGLDRESQKGLFKEYWGPTGIKVYDVLNLLRKFLSFIEYSCFLFFYNSDSHKLVKIR